MMLKLQPALLPALPSSSPRAPPPRPQAQLPPHHAPTPTPRPILSIPANRAAAARREGYQLLDVRPPWERQKSRLRNSLPIPLYVDDPQVDPLTLLKKFVHFGYIGLWTGQRFTALNPNFVSEVERAAPAKDGKLLVACGEGLRSAVAVRKLREGGYVNLALLAGGFGRARDGDFDDVEGSTELRYATVGGVSYYFLQVLLLLKLFGD